MRLLAMLAVVVVFGCALLPYSSIPDNDLRRATRVIVADLAPAELHQGFGFLGTRGFDGQKTPATVAIDRVLVSALRDAGLSPVVDEGEVEKTWFYGDGTFSIPATSYPGLSKLVGSRSYVDGNWVYLQLVLYDKDTGRTQFVSVQRASRQSLESLVRESSDGYGDGRQSLEVDLHVLGLRREGGLAEQIDLSDGAHLRRGDELQIRFRLGIDCDVYAFLVNSNGTMQEIFPKQYVFGGMLQHGPSEDGWIRLGEETAKYTLYFVAAEHLETGTEEMILAINEFVQSSEGDLIPWNRVDATVAKFMLPEGKDEPIYTAGRSREPERFLLADGAVFESFGENLRGTAAVYRALRFSVP